MMSFAKKTRPLGKSLSSTLPISISLSLRSISELSGAASSISDSLTSSSCALHYFFGGDGGTPYSRLGTC